MPIRLPLSRSSFLNFLRPFDKAQGRLCSGQAVLGADCAQGKPPDFTCVITRRSLEEMELREGLEVYIAFKASAVHVF